MQNAKEYIKSFTHSIYQIKYFSISDKLNQNCSFPYSEYNNVFRGSFVKRITGIKAWIQFLPIMPWTCELKMINYCIH